jgi:hypothetical protein
MNNMRLLGHILLWVGFLSGAFIAVRQADPPKEPAAEGAEATPAEGESEAIENDAEVPVNTDAEPADEADPAEEPVEAEATESEDIPVAESDENKENMVADEEAPSPIHWPAYIISLAVAGAGVVLLRLTPKSIDAEQTHTATGTLEDLALILDRVQTKIDDWIAQFDDIYVYDFHGKIDAELSNELGTFADLRELMIPAFGLDHYARIMTEFALAERTINRTWCASADGYIDEVRESLQRASDHLKDAKLRWNDAVSEKGLETPVVEKTDAPEE